MIVESGDRIGSALQRAHGAGFVLPLKGTDRKDRRLLRDCNNFVVGVILTVPTERIPCHSFSDRLLAPGQHNRVIASAWSVVSTLASWNDHAPVNATV